MKTITKFLGAACVVGLGLASTLASTTALAQEKIKIGVSIPAATHGWAGGLNYHAEQAEKRLEATYPNLDIIVVTANGAGEQANDLEELIARSAQCLSICEAMSEAFEERYGQPFQAFANGIDPAQWLEPKAQTEKRLLLRYAGGLAPNMTRDSVLRLARSVEKLAKGGHDIRFEVNTQSWWHEQSKELFADFTHTVIEAKNRSVAQYRDWLNGADAVVIAYNFDDDTLRYVRYSMANKMPECFASQAVLFAHGPVEIATIGYLQSTDAAAVVTEDSDDAVTAALLDLLENPAKRTQLTQAGHQQAVRRHNVNDLRIELRDVLKQMKGTGKGYDLLTHLAAQSGSENALLNCAAAMLLLDGAAMTKRLKSDHVLKHAITTAVQTRPEGSAIKALYQNVSQYVAAQLNP